MDLTNTLRQLSIAFGLGLLVGLQREHVASRLAGIQTFPMVTILGTAHFAETSGTIQRAMHGFYF